MRVPLTSCLLSVATLHMPTAARAPMREIGESPGYQLSKARSAGDALALICRLPRQYFSRVINSPSGFRYRREELVGSACGVAADARQHSRDDILAPFEKRWPLAFELILLTDIRDKCLLACSICDAKIPPASALPFHDHMKTFQHDICSRKFHS